MKRLLFIIEYIWCEVYKQECGLTHNTCFLQLTGNEECLTRLSQCLDVIQEVVESYSRRREEAWVTLSLTPIKETTVLDMVNAVPGIRVCRGQFTFQGDPTDPPDFMANDISSELYWGDGYPHRLLHVEQ